MPAADAKYVTTETVPPLHLPFIAKKVFQMDRRNLEGTLKVTGAKRMFLLARGRFSRIGHYILLGSGSK